MINIAPSQIEIVLPFEPLRQHAVLLSIGMEVFLRLTNPRLRSQLHLSALMI